MSILSQWKLMSVHKFKLEALHVILSIFLLLFKYLLFLDYTLNKIFNECNIFNLYLYIAVIRTKGGQKQ